MYRPEKGHQGQFPLPKHTLDLRFLRRIAARAIVEGPIAGLVAQADVAGRDGQGGERQSLLPLRPFLAGASEVGCASAVLLFSITGPGGWPEKQNVGEWRGAL